MPTCQGIHKTPEVFTYDLDKNLQKDGRWEYSWNSLNQLEKMSLIPTATGTGKARHQVWAFVYDAQGRRVAKRFYEKFGADFAAGAFPEDYYLLEETLFFYDGWNLIAEVNAFTGEMKTYLWGTDLSGSFQGAGGVGGLLAIKDWKTNKTYAVLNDGRGNVTGLVDASSGEQVAKYAYGPFGESVMATGEAREVCPFRFSTKYFDKATGLHYYGYRYYSASMDRWLSRDPIGEEGGVDVYAFVGNDPVNKWDYLGLETFKIVGKSYILNVGNNIGSLKTVTGRDLDKELRQFARFLYLSRSTMSSDPATDVQTDISRTFNAARLFTERTFDVTCRNGKWIVKPSALIAASSTELGVLGTVVSTEGITGDTEAELTDNSWTPTWIGRFTDFWPEYYSLSRFNIF